MLFGIQCKLSVHHENVSQRSPKRFQAFGDIEGILLRVQLSRIESTVGKHAGSCYMVLYHLENHSQSGCGVLKKSCVEISGNISNPHSGTGPGEVLPLP